MPPDTLTTTIGIDNELVEGPRLLCEEARESPDPPNDGVGPRRNVAAEAHGLIQQLAFLGGHQTIRQLLQPPLQCRAQSASCDCQAWNAITVLHECTAAVPPFWLPAETARRAERADRKKTMLMPPWQCCPDLALPAPHQTKEAVPPPATRRRLRALHGQELPVCSHGQACAPRGWQWRPFRYRLRACFLANPAAAQPQGSATWWEPCLCKGALGQAG